MDARLLARDRSVEAVEKLITIMRDAAATHTAQIIAANSILDRGYGRPHQSVEMTGKDGDPIEHHEGSALPSLSLPLARSPHPPHDAECPSADLVTRCYQIAGPRRVDSNDGQAPNAGSKPATPQARYLQYLCYALSG